MCRTIRVVVVLVAALWPGLVSATGGGPEGAWETRDDRTGARRALVRVSIRDGRLAGVIERLFVAPGEEPDPICNRCDGNLHNKPVVGMEILSGGRRDGDRWVGGSILDPENGKEYRSSVWLEGQDRLRVRGYWGPFWRTQTWWRPRDDGETPSETERRAPEGQR
jgi:uncharacterized protein (DUF2147 family)